MIQIDVDTAKARSNPIKSNPHNKTLICTPDNKPMKSGKGRRLWIIISMLTTLSNIKSEATIPKPETHHIYCVEYKKYLNRLKTRILFDFLNFKTSSGIMDSMSKFKVFLTICFDH